MDVLVRGLWEELVLPMFSWVGNFVLSIQILGVPILGWIVGMIILSGLGSIILSVRPNITLGRTVETSKDAVVSARYKYKTAKRNKERKEKNQNKENQ